jgi:hypothetical protein
MTDKIPSAPPLYPTLSTDDGQNYRLQKISELEQLLIHERDVRASLFKKYKRGINIVDAIDTTLIAASLGMGTTGLILIPLMLPLEITAGVFGLIGIAGRFISRRLQSKAKKHDEITIIAESN